MTDESTPAVPDEWRDVLHPRRDRPGGPAPSPPDPERVDRARSLVDGARAEIERALASPGGDPEIAAAGRAHLRGDASPLGAAAVAATVDRDVREPAFAEAWLAEHGAAFAAAAFTAWAGLDASDTGVRRLPADASLGFRVGGEPARWLRAHLAAAPDDVYAAAVAGIGEHRGDPLQDIVAAYLVPTREDWVEEVCAFPDRASARYAYQRWLALCALGHPHQATALPFDPFDQRLDVVATLVDGVGPEAVVPLLAAALDGATAPDAVRELSGMLAVLPVDGAFRALAARMGRPAVPPAVLAASRRFPVRALRLLPEATAPRAAELLAAHVRTHPDLAARTLPALPPGPRDAVRAVLDAGTRPPSPADLPPLLTAPPWTRPGAAAAPVVVKDLAPPGVRDIAWRPGEREEWAREPARWRQLGEEIDYADAAARFRAGTCGQYVQDRLLVKGPDELVLPLLDGWEPREIWSVHDWLPPLVARFGTLVHDPVLSAVRRDPAGLAGYLMPLVSDEIARSMAGWLRPKRVRPAARAWFVRHGPAAAPSLVPDAFGAAGPARRAAEEALRLVASRHGAEPVVAAARVHGDAAAAGIEALLSTDPLDVLPTKIPPVDWIDVRVLPPLLLRDRTHALPDEAAAQVLTMLAMSTPDAPYAGVRVVRELCDPESLAEFGWALFRWWEMCGAPSKDGWALSQLALTGDDETVRRLAPVIRAWPGEGGHAKAVTGLDVLAGIGTETALLHLNSIAQRVKFKGLKTRAQEKIEELAAELELTADQLADRLVPDFGLDASGTLTLDYGPRRFVVGFDEQLKPVIADEDGKVRKALPKPGAADDPDLAPAAHKRFAGLKKDVRTVAADQIGRFERAMVTGRRWTLPEFRDHLAGHPLVGHLVRRLVWLAEDGDADGPVAFRVAEDGTFADAADDAIVLPETARVGVAHPVHLGDEVKAWTEVFTDYEILQPFEQLARPTHMIAPDERDGGRLPRFTGADVHVGALLGLTGRGWERGTPLEAGVERCVSRELAPGRYLVVSLAPGIPAGDPDLLGETQTLTDVRVAADRDPHRPDEPASLRFADLDPAVVSEVLADLVRLTGRAEATGG
ncbi:DUF4132 domain-containing protein [Spirillospora sp. NPDC052242]